MPTNPPSLPRIVSFTEFNAVGRQQLPRHVIPNLRAYVVSLVS